MRQSGALKGVLIIYFYTLVFSFGLFQDELNSVKIENTNLNKQVGVLSKTTPRDPTSVSQNAMDDKNKAFLELRDSFEEVISQKDTVVNTLREKLDQLRAEYRNQSKDNTEVLKQQEENTKTSASLVESSRLLDEVTKQRDWLKNELDRVVTEKEDLSGAIHKRFDSISSGLREDVENAFKDREEYENAFEIHRLQLEQKVKNQSDELNELRSQLSEKEQNILEKGTLISMLEGRVEKSADILSKEKYYDNLEQRLQETDEKLSSLANEKEELATNLDALTHQYENTKDECNLAVSEKNQLKLTADSKVEEFQLKKAQEFQDLRNNFENAMNERDSILQELQKKLHGYDADKECELKELERSLKEDFTQSEMEYQDKVLTLEGRLNDLVNDKEKKVQQVMVTAEKDRNDQLESLQSDFNTLLHVKDEKIKTLTNDTERAQQNLSKKEVEVESLKNSLQSVDNQRDNLAKQVDRFKSAMESLERNKESEIEQVIINKGKGLKDLRNEFETVFEEKNKIIEDMRSKMKELRKTVSTAHQETRSKDEKTRELEQLMTEIETGKLGLEAKTSLLTETTADLKIELDSLKKEKKDQEKYVEQLLQENSNLVSSFDQQSPTIVEPNTELLAQKRVLDSIKEIISSVPGVEVSDSIVDLHQGVRQIVKLLDESKPNTSKDEQAGINADVQTLQKRLEQMQKELVQLTSEKENVENNVRERYEDILGNLREDLTHALQTYRSLQEENFSLKNQMDVFTNVDAKRIQSLPVPKNRPQFVGTLAGLAKPPSGVQSILPEELLQSFAAPQDSFLEQSFDASPIKDNVRLEFIEPTSSSVQESNDSEPAEGTKTSDASSTHKNVVKLKKLCRKYKDNLHESQEENTTMKKEMEALKQNLRSVMERTSDEKVRYEREIQVLRGEVDALVSDKSSLVGHFKTRNEDDAAQNRQRLFDLQSSHQNEMQMANIKIDECLRELNSRDDIIEQQLSEKQNSEQLHDQLEQMLHEREAELQFASENLRQWQTKYEQEKQSAEEKETAIHYLDDDVENLKASLDRLIEESKPKETSNVEIDNPQFDELVIESYRSDSLQIKKDMNDMANERDATNERVSELSSQLKELENHLEKLGQEKFASETTVKSLREDVSRFVGEKENIVQQWRSRLQQTEAEHSKAAETSKVEIDSLTNELASAHSEIHNLNDTLQDQLEHSRQHEARGEAQGESLHELTKDLQKTSQQRDQYKTNLETSRMEVVALQKRFNNKNQELERAVSSIKEIETSLAHNQKTINLITLELSQATRLSESLKQDIATVKKEKEELEGRVRREVQQAYDELVARNSTLRTETFTKEKSLQDLRRELGTLVREKEFLQTAMKGQFATSGVSNNSDNEYLRFQVQQLRREKDETNKNNDKLGEDLKRKLEEISKEKDAVTLRMATLRAMLEQEVKDHEKTKFFKEQLSQGRGVSLDKLKLSVTGMKDNLRSLKKDMDVNMSGIREACQDFVLNLAPTMLNAQASRSQPPTAISTGEATGLLKLQLEDKAKELGDAWNKIKGLQTSNRIADSRLRDLVEVLQEIGVIQQVQVRSSILIIY